MRNILIILLMKIEDNTCLDLDLVHKVLKSKLGDILVLQGMNVNVNDVI